MAYNFTCIIGNDQIPLDPMSGDTKLCDLLKAVQRKSGIPPNRQQLMADSGNVDTSDHNKTLLQLALSNNCCFLILDSNPDGDLEILPSPKKNDDKQLESQYAEHLSQLADNDNDIAMKDNNNNNDEIKEEKENKIDDDEDEYVFPPFELPSDENKIDGELLNNEDVHSIFALLFGFEGNEKDQDRWFAQGFGFVEDKHHNNDIRFGLLQIHGGPCGVLAPVQAYMLKEMLFNKKLEVMLEDGSQMPVLPTNEQREEALICALIEILCKTAIDETYISWIVAADRKTAKYYRKIVKSPQELRETIKSSMKLLQSSIGVISFLFSLILSRTTHIILDEVDDKTQPLVLPQFGHCSQELVNLMITGKCVTNIHDGDKVLGDPNDPDVFTLRGIEPNQQIGFLTTLEPMRLAKVGDHYKCPAFPIWVVGSSSHYTTLFSLDINVGKLSKFEEKKQKLRRAFNKFDHEENGIIPYSKLDDLLKSINSEFKSYQIKQIMDPENTNHVFWSTFERGMQMLENQKNVGWHCQKCTFWNKFDASFCEICISNKGDAPIIPKPKEKQIESTTNNENEPPKSFTMYLYNGLKTTKKDRPQVTKLSVFDEAEVQQFNNYGEELTGLIRTKFPYAIVEFDGPFAPKIV